MITRKKLLTAFTPEYTGPCVPVWFNENGVDRRLFNGPFSITGFFRPVRKVRWWRFEWWTTCGKLFHGGIMPQNMTTVLSTENYRP